MRLKKKNPKDLSFILGVGGTAKGVGQLMGMGILTLQNMKKRAKLGSSIKDGDVIPGSASVYFFTQDSVSELITQLTKMRKDMKNATNPVSVRHPDKRRKIPRKRAKR